MRMNLRVRIAEFKNPTTHFNPVSTISVDAFLKAREFLRCHKLLHYFLHNTYCRLSKHFKFVRFWTEDDWRRLGESRQ